MNALQPSIAAQLAKKCLWLFAAAVAALVAWAVFSIGYQRTLPLDEPATGVLATATKPVVDALAWPLQRQIRRVLSRESLLGDISESETIASFLDRRTPDGERRILANRLARLNTPAAVEALVRAFREAPPERLAFMAQLLGSTGHPAMKPLLLPLLEHDDAEVVAATIRGLAAIGGPEITAAIEQVLADGTREEGVRVEAALALGEIGSTSARDTLAATLTNDPDSELTNAALTALGKMPFARVAPVFEQFLANAETPAELRATAVEALAFSTKEAVPFLLDAAARDADEEVRASAAWAISAHDPRPGLGPQLVALAQSEPEADVRRRIYEALLPQTELAAAQVLSLATAETDVSARVAGFNVLGAAAGRAPASALAAQFDNAIVPELQRIAANENTVNVRMRAVFALRRANTPAARAALAALATSSTPQIAAAASHGLPPAK